MWPNWNGGNTNPTWPNWGNGDSQPAWPDWNSGHGQMRPGHGGSYVPELPSYGYGYDFREEKPEPKSTPNPTREKKRDLQSFYLE